MAAHQVTRRVAVATTIVLAATVGATAQRLRDLPHPDIAIPHVGLPDIVLGRPDARVTIVEYLSLTCSHCARFHRDVLPGVKARHIDTGQARLVLRDFPLDTLAAAAALLVRCAGPARSLGVMATLLDRQAEWAVGTGAEIKLYMLLRDTADFTQAAFDACLRDASVLSRIEAAMTHAERVYGVDGTPAFFVEGRRLTGHTEADFERAIDISFRSGG